MKKLTLTTALGPNLKFRKNFTIQKNRCSNCIFCQKLSKSNHSFKSMLSKALYNKYSSSQNYYYTKDINDLLSKSSTASVINLKEHQMMLSEKEYLQKYLKLKEIKIKLIQLTEYFKYHRDIPRIYIKKIAKIIYKFHDKKRRIFYRKVKQQLGIKDEEIETTTKKQDYTQTLKNILQGVKLDLTKTTYAEHQESKTFLNILHNIKENNQHLFSDISFQESFHKDNKIDFEALDFQQKKIHVPKLQLPSPTIQHPRPLSSSRIKIKAQQQISNRESSNEVNQQPNHQKSSSQFTTINKHFIYPGLATTRTYQRVQLQKEDFKALSNIYKSQVTSPSRIISKIQIKGTLLQKSKINSKVQSCANSPVKSRKIIDFVVRKKK